MYIKIKFNHYLLILVLVVPCNVAILFGDFTKPEVSQTSGINIFFNLFGMTRFKDHSFTSVLDASGLSKGLFQLLKGALRSYAGRIGERNVGTTLQRPLLPSAPFLCRTAGQRSEVVPDSVHRLRPGDIDIVAAMGDSITVGTGGNAVDLFEVLNDQRGISFSGGGYRNFRTHLTVPNILKEFNPRLFGYAWTDAWSTERGAQFNLAVNGAAATDMPYQAVVLIRRMLLDRRVNMKKHWKLITLMIGTNDFCSDICTQKDGPLWMNREIEQSIIKTLRIIRDRMPRTLVNLVTHPSVSMILSMDGLKNLPTYCHFGRLLQCGCLEGQLYSEHKKLYMLLEQEYRRIFQRIARRPEFRLNDFEVVFQPFGVNATVFIHDRKPDISIMAVDCLHLSQKGQAVFANALWNNMMQPEGKKSIGLKPLFEEFECPTEQNPYIRTSLNS